LIARRCRFLPYNILISLFWNHFQVIDFADRLTNQDYRHIIPISLSQAVRSSFICFSISLPSLENFTSSVQSGVISLGKLSNEGKKWFSILKCHKL
jgi:hypothetical protein